MKKIFCFFCFFCLVFIETSFAQDDDSTPYMPYAIPQRVGTDQASPQNTQPSATQKTASAKKSSSKKKTAPAKKKTASASKKTAASRMSSLQQGIALMQQTKYEAARPYLLKAIQEEKNNPNAWYWYGVYHERTGGYHQAQYFYAKAVTIDPAFEPLSRIVFQPNDSDKTPLWDPKRPARVYEIQASNTGGIGSVTPNSLGLSSFPSAPNDPETPRVPVYVPPDPGTSPLNGDSWNAGIYVPPSRSELGLNEGNSAVYVPPSSQGIIAQDSATYRQVAEIPIYRQPDGTTARVSSAQDDRIIRADLPLYTPPTPEEQAARQAQQVRTPAVASTASAERKTASVPASRVVRQNTARKRTTTTTARPAVTAPATKRATPTRTPATRTASRDARPTRPATPATPRTPATTQARPAQPAAPARTPAQTPARPAQPVTQQRQPEPARTVEPETTSDTSASRNSEYMPPVGQYSPDPGTISETPIPPVGQGGQD